MSSNKIIALLLTTGNRSIENSISSINNQKRKVDEIIIASEIKIDSEYLLLVNVDNNGLAVNTTQSLNKIWLKYKENNVFIATLDDDDIWYEDYIEKVEEKINEGFNFIAGSIDIFVDGIFSEKSVPEISKNFDYYLYNNDGVQGSNKVFKLEIALENGAMFRTINSSTDRMLNTNLLSDSRTKYCLINDSVVRQNRDTNRVRITNDPSRINNLKEFYKKYWNLIDKDKIDEINERHKKLHGFEKVIEWK